MSEIKRFGIDVSHWQGDFDFARAKSKEGVEFAILKAGGGDAGLYKDSKFEANYKKCEECGLPKGAYFYGNAKSVAEAKKEAEYFISILSGKKYEYPVFYDVEGKMISDNNRATLTEIVKAFCSTMEAAGYWVGIYSSESFFNSEMDDGELIRYSHWVARWGKSKPAPTSGAETQMWQFGGETNLIRSNKINGQTCDQDYCYVDYPAKIKAAGLNGYSKGGNAAPAKKTSTEIADEVIAGKWGNGAERKERLTDAGYNYSEIQDIVNGKLGAKPKKSVDEIAREVIHGDWGNGAERKQRLTAAGYDYAAIQHRVNELLS
ncbi:GH25 family lysozyme [Oscillospiraceae bacterium LCP25S3_E3]